MSSDQLLLVIMAADNEITGLHHIKWVKIQLLATETQRTQRYLSPQMNADKHRFFYGPLMNANKRKFY